MNSLESKCNLQKNRLNLLSNACDYFKDKDISTLSKSQIQIRMEVLESNWIKFEKDNDRIFESKPELLKDLLYITEDYYSAAHEAYINSKSFMCDLLNSLPGNNLHSDSSFNSSSTQKPFLPKITLPRFAGNYQEWQPFSDLFSSLVIENSELSEVAKMHYLKSSLEKEAAQLISNFQVSGENFVIAWEKLKRRYENKRILINKHLDNIFKIKPLSIKSAKNLSNLMATVNESLGSIKSLGSPTDYWDHIIIYIIVNRLDAETHEAWEIHQGTSVEPSSLLDLQNFIDGRARALESIEMRTGSTSTGIKSQGNSSYKFKVHTSSSDPPRCNNCCILCKESHYLSKCKSFSLKSPVQRKEYLISQKLCFNCLGPHMIKDCRSLKTCQTCKKRHHTLIHDSFKQNDQAGTNSLLPFTVKKLSSKNDDLSSEVLLHSNSEATTNHAQPNFTKNKSVVLLATAQVNVLGPDNNVVRAKALIDQGSEISFISEYLVQSLHLPRKSASISLLGIGGNQSAVSRGQVSVTLSPIYASKVKSSVSISACILPKLTSLLPSMSLPNSSWPHIEGLELADPSFMTPGSIDLILGADIYSELILPGLIKGSPLTPIAQSTIFGWILSGPVGSMFNNNKATMHHCMSFDDVHKQMERFWVQEEIPEKLEPSVSIENQRCEEFFKSSFKRTKSGRYEVRLPLKESAELLGDSHSSALKMLQSLQPRISSASEYGKLYKHFIHEYESLDHMSEVPPDQLKDEPSYYLPHHGVMRSSSSSTKLRVVFNASHQTSSKKSLNDILYSGPKLQTDLPDVLTWFRRFKYVFVSDIEKMYRQVLVNPNDWNLQRILWLEDGNLHTYQLKTVTYGLSCAPYLALRTLDQLIIDEGNNFPLAKETLKRGRYVDDVFGGDETAEKCAQLAEQVDKLCAAGCFPLKKWISNNPSVLKDISPDRHGIKDTLSLETSTVVKTLGLSWNPTSDSFNFCPNVEPIEQVTKRNILSAIAKFFDPLGFIAPVIIQFKVFIQQLWLIKLGWDDLLPSHLIKQWQQFEGQLKDLPLIRIPRFLDMYQSSIIELHGFSDASLVAMSAIIYIKVTNQDSTTISFVCAKTKVAPLKKMTVPRLELTAATMLVKLAKYVRKVLDLNTVPLYLWIDSSVALTWITNPPSKWKEFVSNRVNFIQETEPSAHWRFVSGTENPADCASRGITPKLLSNHHLWWNGPTWLLEDSGKWPCTNFTPVKEAFSEERRLKVSHVSQQRIDPDILIRFSSLTKLLRVTAWCLLFIQRCKRKTEISPKSYLTPHDLNDTLKRWIGLVQQSCFKNELKSLQFKKPIDKSSSLLSLNPFIDNDGLIRVSGRLSQSSLCYDSKHPYILPKDSRLTTLVINDAHLRTLHGGIRDTLSTVRQKCWILGGRPTVKKELLRCVICARYRADRAHQLMGQLPATRLTPSRPFLHSGVDYAGPFIIKTWCGRNAKSYKGYVAVFICSSTSAIHLELVTDYTSNAFLAAYKRFTARRGICATLTSDCGTTFIGAAAEMKRQFSKASSEIKHLRALLANDGTEWRFNPPGAPHFGGRWEAGVKSVKYHLKRVIGNHLLTYEEFSTLLTQTESILNSRPLCQLTEDPDDLAALTPAHFLVGEPLNIVPEPNLSEVPTSRLTRWKLMKQMLDSFWKKWYKEYLQQFQTIYKWRFPTSTIKIGSIVLVTDEQYPPSKWPLAKVIALHPGYDSLTRVVTLKTAKGTIKRPIVKLCPLPVDVI